MKKAKNEKEFLELIKRYQTVSKSEIEEAFAKTVISDTAFDILQYMVYDTAKTNLTGFGQAATCTLCRAVSDKFAYPKCEDCVWSKTTSGPADASCGYHSDNAVVSSFRKISFAASVYDLLIAYRERAQVMINHYELYKNPMKKREMRKLLYKLPFLPTVVIWWKSLFSKDDQPFWLKVALYKMCLAVGADYDDIDFKKEGWFMRYTWTEKEEKEYRDWLTNLLKNRNAMFQIGGHTLTLKEFREKAANAFVFNYGWKYGKKENESTTD